MFVRSFVPVPFCIFDYSYWDFLYFWLFVLRLLVFRRFFVTEVTFGVWLCSLLISWCSMYMLRHSFVSKIYKKYQSSLFITLFFIRTGKFCLRLNVLNFFFIFEAEIFLICSYFPDWTLQCHKEECQTEYYKNTLFHFFHSFSFKQRT